MDLTPSQDEPTNQVLMPPSVGDLPEQRQPVPDVKVKKEDSMNHQVGHTQLPTLFYLGRIVRCMPRSELLEDLAVLGTNIVHTQE